MMYKIAVSVQHLKEELTLQQRNFRKKLVYTLSVCGVLVYIGQEIATYEVEKWTYAYSNITNASYLTGLFILYLSTMLYTFSTLRRLHIDLKKEEKAIL